MRSFRLKRKMMWYVLPTGFIAGNVWWVLWSVSTLSSRQESAPTFPSATSTTASRAVFLPPSAAKSMNTVRAALQSWALFAPHVVNTSSRPSVNDSLGLDGAGLVGNSSQGSSDSREQRLRHPRAARLTPLNTPTRQLFPAALQPFPTIIPSMNSVAPGAHAARHARPSGVELPGASRADLPPNDAALCPRWGAHHWLKCRPRVDLPPYATPLCPRWGPDHWRKCRAAIRRKLGLGAMQCPTKCVTFGRYGRLNNNVYQLVNTFMAYVEPSLVNP